jgi:poly(3-hydroxybutyrate) depolymerase
MPVCKLVRFMFFTALLVAGCSAKGDGDAANPAGSGGTGGAAGTPIGAGGSAAGAGAGAGGMARAGSGASGPCMGKPGAVRGKSMQMLMAAGLQRSFVYYAPAGLDPNVPAPVVIVAHGYTMSGEMMFGVTKYAELADREKFVVMFPNGQPGASGPWNVGNPTCSSTLGVLPLATGDDQAFLDAMLGFAEADQCVDRAHVFVTGFSMGGYFANATGCARPTIRAIAPHSGGTHELTMCASQHKPALIMHFNGDALIPTMCGEEARTRWVMHNGCSMDAPNVRMVQGGSCEYYKNCPADGQVAFCKFDIPMGGKRDEAFAGHAWSGGSDEGGGNMFAIPETASATELGWAFFKEFAW